MGLKIKVLNSDQGGEYQGHDFVKYLKSKGTVQKLNVHDTPQHAGVAERHNQMIGEQICALLHASGLPKFLWGEAARHIIWLLNRTTTKAVEGMTLSGDLPPVLPYTSQPMHSTSCLPIHHHTTTLHYCLRLQHYH